MAVRAIQAKRKHVREGGMTDGSVQGKVQVEGV